MGLQNSGPISIGDIRTELGVATGSLRALSAEAGFSTPDSMAEFYGYSAMALKPITLGGAPFSSGEEACAIGVQWGTNVFYYLDTGSGFVESQLYYTEDLNFPVNFEPSWWYFVDYGISYFISEGIVMNEYVNCG